MAVRVGVGELVGVAVGTTGLLLSLPQAEKRAQLMTSADAINPLRNAIISSRCPLFLSAILEFPRPIVVALEIQDSILLCAEAVESGSE